MRKVKILVVEDEIIIADNICDTLEILGYEVFEPAMNFTEAIAAIEKEQPDIAILDIQLSGNKTGIDLAKQIRKNYNFPFALTSNADSYTLNLAKEVLPPAYLIKPFTKDALFSAIEIALHNFSQKVNSTKKEDVIIKDSIFIKDKGCYKKVLFDDILFLKSAHVYVEIFLKSKQEFVVRLSLNEILEHLNESFVRVHRSYIVNTKYLVGINQNVVKILDQEVPIGKKYKEAIVTRINLV